ncbi:F-box domain-containing protein [Favolaschia claudopus]|uniref:F-box domain-containing protein n=1 Tax=Favolaschia claudopus TaxID=2862362 RepID=A0AAW0D9H0_9AGAR
MNSQPEDILREIFKRCLDTDFPHMQPFRPTEAPMLLCGVCVLWRTIALTMSELWARLSVSIGREASEQPQPATDLIQLWISRSNRQPLTLVLKDLGQRANTTEAAHRVLQLFVLHIHRWQNITLALPNLTFPSALVSPNSGASELRIANLEFGIDPELQIHDSAKVAALTRLLTVSSQLHTLYWQSDALALQCISIHWARLTVLDLVPVWWPMSAILHLMEQAPKLRSLSTLMTGACPVVRPIVLPDLVILWINCDADVGPFFKLLTVPSLQNLNVSRTNATVPAPQTDVVRCLTRSGIQLHAAIFTSLYLPNSEFIDFLRLSSSLQLLEISNNGAATITDEILRLLTPGDIPCLCPNLQTIRFLEDSVFIHGYFTFGDGGARRAPQTSSAFPIALLSQLVVDFTEPELSKHTHDIHRLRTLGQTTGFRAWINEPETGVSVRE